MLLLRKMEVVVEMGNYYKTIMSIMSSILFNRFQLKDYLVLNNNKNILLNSELKHNRYNRLDSSIPINPPIISI
jgi:hypothetical protein